MLFSRFLLCFLAVTLWVNASSATENGYKCPKLVTAMLGEGTSKIISDYVTGIYHELGCGTEFKYYPTKRAIKAFNAGVADGEIFRQPIAEKYFSRPFIRSSYPVQTVRNILWKHPSAEDANEDHAIGYSRGVFWSKEYAEGKRTVVFNSSRALIDAYNRGAIQHMLLSDFNLNSLKQKVEIHDFPIVEQEISVGKLYHYLDREFLPFMKVFDNKIKERDALLASADQ